MTTKKTTKEKVKKAISNYINKKILSFDSDSEDSFKIVDERSEFTERVLTTYVNLGDKVVFYDHIDESVDYIMVNNKGDLLVAITEDRESFMERWGDN